MVDLIQSKNYSLQNFTYLQIFDRIQYMKATKEQLLGRIKNFLELPGVCDESKYGAILTNCKKIII